VISDEKDRRVKQRTSETAIGEYFSLIHCFSVSLKKQVVSSAATDH